MVLPIEMGVRSLRIVLESEIPGVDWLQSRFDQLCMMNETQGLVSHSMLPKKTQKSF